MSELFHGKLTFHLPYEIVRNKECSACCAFQVWSWIISRPGIWQYESPTNISPSFIMLFFCNIQLISSYHTCSRRSAKLNVYSHLQSRPLPDWCLFLALQQLYVNNEAITSLLLDLMRTIYNARESALTHGGGITD